MPPFKQVADTALTRELQVAMQPYSPEQFAVLVGCGCSTVFRWMRGEAVPTGTAYINNLVKLGVSRRVLEDARDSRKAAIRASKTLLKV